MAELRVMDALREKRFELSGVVSRLEQQLAQHRGSLAHLDATMRLFDPDLLPRNPDPAPQRGRVSSSRRLGLSRPCCQTRRGGQRRLHVGMPASTKPQVA